MMINPATTFMASNAALTANSEAFALAQCVNNTSIRSSFVGISTLAAFSVVLMGSNTAAAQQTQATQETLSKFDNTVIEINRECQDRLQSHQTGWFAAGVATGIPASLLVIGAVKTLIWAAKKGINTVRSRRHD